MRRVRQGLEWFIESLEGSHPWVGHDRLGNSFGTLSRQR